MIRTHRLNSAIGCWREIDEWLRTLQSAERRKAREQAREQEAQAARERIRRDNRSAAAFDRRTAERRAAR